VGACLDLKAGKLLSVQGSMFAAIRKKDMGVAARERTTRNVEGAQITDSAKTA
jgi:hypothetical protein